MERSRKGSGMSRSTVKGQGKVVFNPTCFAHPIPKVRMVRSEPYNQKRTLLHKSIRKRPLLYEAMPQVKAMALLHEAMPQVKAMVAAVRGDATSEGKAERFSVGVSLPVSKIATFTPEPLNPASQSSWASNLAAIPTSSPCAAADGDTKQMKL